MLSALVLVEPHALRDPSACVRDVAKTLASLVGFVVADLVADALIVTQPGVDFEPIEQTAGCLVSTDARLSVALSHAATMARRKHLLLLRPGFTPDTGFSDEIVSALEAKPDETRAVRAVPETILQRIAPGLSPVAGLVLVRASVPAASADRDVTLDRIAEHTRAQTMRTRAIRL